MALTDKDEIVEESTQNINEFNRDNIDQYMSFDSDISANSEIQINISSNLCICIAGIFLIISIICAIFFKKYQLKLKKKSSK